MSYVYILTNEAMPGYIKIGLTENPVSQRVVQLDNTSVALPFQCYYAARVDDNRRIERALHTAFGDFRVRPNREFFKMDPYKVKAILEVLALEDVTPKNELVATAEDAQALRNVGIKAGRFRFSSAAIPIGATLNFVKDLNLTATVEEESWVVFSGEKHSLTTAALEALKKCGYNWSSVQGPEYWLYNGESVGSLRARQREIEESAE
jgi:T5orf172 domain